MYVQKEIQISDFYSIIAQGQNAERNLSLPDGCFMAKGILDMISKKLVRARIHFSSHALLMVEQHEIFHPSFPYFTHTRRPIP